MAPLSLPPPSTTRRPRVPCAAAASNAAIASFNHNFRDPTDVGLLSGQAGRWSIMLPPSIKLTRAATTAGLEKRPPMKAACDRALCHATAWHLLSLSPRLPRSGGKSFRCSSELRLCVILCSQHRGHLFVLPLLQLCRDSGNFITSRENNKFAQCASHL